MVEFIVLFGPPCCGKTFFCSQLIRDFSEKRYVRVSPSELFYKTPDLSLHKVINRITSLLQKGHSVILDDTQQSQVERTRRTYIQAIKNKIPNCNFLAVLLYPEGGKLQSCWANEFAFSENSILLDKNGNTTSSSSYREPDIENWFLHSSVPKSEEGFSEIREVSSNFKIHQSVPFSRKAILLNACSILDFQPQFRADSFGAFDLKPSVQNILLEYLEAENQETPRVIVLVDESSLFPTTLELFRSELLQQKKAIDHYRNQMRKSLNQLATFVKQPIFYLISAYNMFAEKDFFRLPNPGMVAWLQFRHQIDLDQTIYIGPSITKSLCESVGITFCDGEMFFKSSGWTISSKISKFGTNFFERRPHFLLEPEYISTVDSTTHCDTLQQFTNHYSRISSNEFAVEEKGGPGRFHGVCFPQNVSNISDTNSLVTNLTTHSESSRSERVLPDWMFMESVTTIPSSSNKKRPTTHKTQRQLSHSSHSNLQTSNSHSNLQTSNSDSVTEIKTESSPYSPQEHRAHKQDFSTIQVKIENENNFQHPPLEPISGIVESSTLTQQLTNTTEEEPDIQTLLAKHFGTSALSVFQSNGNPNKRTVADQSPENSTHKKPKQSLQTLLSS